MNNNTLHKTVGLIMYEYNNNNSNDHPSFAKQGKIED